MNTIDKLSDEIRNCKICITNPIGSPLPHTPRPVAVLSATAKIAICGQAPGNRVNQSGIPFTDPSGDRLRDWLGVNEETFYDSSKFAIIPMGFCFPGNDAKGGDLPPRKECRLKWHSQVFEAMPQLKLKLLIGGSAQNWHMGSSMKKSVTETVANWQAYLSQHDEKGVVMFPLPHPSWRNSGWIRKHPWFENDLLPQLKEMISGFMSS